MLQAGRRGAGWTWPRMHKICCAANLAVLQIKAYERPALPTDLPCMKWLWQLDADGVGRSEFASKPLLAMVNPWRQAREIQLLAYLIALRLRKGVTLTPVPSPTERPDRPPKSS